LIADILAESMPAAKRYDALNEVPCGGCDRGSSLVKRARFLLASRFGKAHD
jgi:hypothetical protein